MKDLKGRRALVTGAASGMGRTTSLELAREGVDLILVDIRGEPLGQVAREAEACGVDVHTFSLDLADWDQVKRAADTIHSRWGAVDVLVNCAGVLYMSHIMDTTVEDWQRLLGVNLWSIIHTVKAFAPEMMRRKSGHIVNISSGQAYFAVPMSGAYASTKYAVDGYSEALHYELHWHGIGVTTVYPGIVRTHLYDRVSGSLLIRLAMKVILATAAKPEKLGRMIVDGIKKNRRIVNQSLATWTGYLLKHIMPWPFEAVGLGASWLLRREEGESDLDGR